jgi:hypothetical protein
MQEDRATRRTTGIATRMREGGTEGREGEVVDCTSCRVIGTVVPLAASAYLTATLYTIKPPQGMHKAFTLAFAGAFAVLGVFRAVV